MDVISDVLVQDMSLISYVKDAGLVLFVWGEGCNDKELILKFKDSRVDGIIYDRSVLKQPTKHVSYCL